MHATADPTEQVMGFVGAYSVQQKRLFISYSELPANWRFETGYEKCIRPDTILPAQAATIFQAPGYLPIETLYFDSGAIRAYTGSNATCVDCRLRGSNIEPVFWK